ncbi:MAG: YhcH/YjgK/YiaL family protein [Prolixibacteraceae bacterium]|jgi:YhcH/YjgK/YiaL family protein|nr:YhcH/YjgK/YiaL family protein [Prolixibacteraceae bacterium]
MSYLFILTSVFSCSNPTSKNPQNWSEKETTKWFESGDWKSGWDIAPDESINKEEFALQYFRNKTRWNQAFTFLATNDLSKLELGKHELDGSNLYISVDEYLTKDEEDSRFEAHRKYADIQYLISGEEQIGVTVLENTTETISYDNTKDVVFLTTEQNNYRLALPEKFFVFLPGDAHRPGVKVANNIKVRKIVVKVRID